MDTPNSRAQHTPKHATNTRVRPKPVLFPRGLLSRGPLIKLELKQCFKSK